MRALYCLLGDPVAHSRSPAIHARAFSLLGVDAVYAPCRVAPEELPFAVEGLRALGAAGFNVTVPHKERTTLLIDEIHPSAQRIGAVNCVVRKDDALVGHNTDQDGILGALEMLETRSSADVPPIDRRPAVVVGAGGSARAAVHALPGCSIVNRTRARAEALAREFGATVAEITALREAALVVNCTSVGLRDDAVPFDVAQLRPDAIVLDLVYRGPTGETALVKTARARGLQAIDGVAVLVHQAIASLEAWLERDDLSDLYEPLREAALR